MATSLWLLGLATVLLSVQIGVLNMPQFYMSCYLFKLPSNVDSQKTVITHWWQDWLGEQCVPIKNDENWSQIISFFYIGGLVGTILTDFNNFYHIGSLRIIMIISQILIIGGNTLLTTANNFQTLCLSRLIIGIGSGCQFNIIPIYLQLYDDFYKLLHSTTTTTTAILALENKNDKFNIVFETFNYLLFPIGIFIVQILSLPFLDSFHWRWILFTWCVFNLIQLFLFIIYLHDSPKWYLMKGNVIMAKKILLKYTDITNSDKILNIWQNELNNGVHSSNHSIIINKPLHNGIDKIKYYFKFLCLIYKENNLNIHNILLLQCINFNFFNQYGIKIFIELIPESTSFILQIFTSISSILSVTIFLFIQSNINLRKIVTINLGRFHHDYQIKLNLKLIVYLLQIICMFGIFINFQPNQIKNFINWLILFTILSHNNIMYVPICSETNWLNIVEICQFRLIKFSYWVGNIVTSYSFPILFDIFGHYIFLIWIILFTLVLIIDQEILLT